MAGSRIVCFSRGQRCIGSLFVSPRATHDGTRRSGSATGNRGGERRKGGRGELLDIRDIIHVTLLRYGLIINYRPRYIGTREPRRLDYFLEYCSAVSFAEAKPCTRLLFHLAHLLRFRVLYVRRRSPVRRSSWSKSCKPFSSFVCKYLRLSVTII